MDIYFQSHDIQCVLYLVLLHDDITFNSNQCKYRLMYFGLLCYYFLLFLFYFTVFIL